MRLIDKHILRAWGKAFLQALAATIGVLLLENMYTQFPKMLQEGVCASNIIMYYLLLIPTFLPVVVPVSLLFSSLFSLGVLHQNNEIIAMRAAGLHISSICRSLWFAGGAIAAVLLYLNAYFVPYAVEETRAMRLEFKANVASDLYTRFAKEAVGVGFLGSEANDLWYLDRIDTYNWSAKGINVYSRNDQGKEVSRIHAQSGVYDFDRLSWTLNNGYIMQFGPAGEPNRISRFESQIFPDLKDSPVLMVNLGKPPKDLSLGELRQIINHFPLEENANIRGYYIKYQRILASSLTCLIVVGLSIPFATSGVRVNPVVGASKVIGLFFVFFILSGVSNMLGAHGYVSPFVGAWLPSFLAVLFTLNLYKRVK